MPSASARVCRALYLPRSTSALFRGLKGAIWRIGCSLGDVVAASPRCVGRIWVWPRVRYAHGLHQGPRDSHSTSVAEVGIGVRDMPLGRSCSPRTREGDRCRSGGGAIFVNESAEYVNPFDIPHRLRGRRDIGRRDGHIQGRCRGADEPCCSGRHRRSGRVRDGGGSRPEPSPGTRCGWCAPSVRRARARSLSVPAAGF